MISFLTQLFLYGFCFDALLSFWAEFYQVQAGSFAEIRALIAFSAVAQGLVLYVCMMFTRKISFRLVGLPAIFLIWANLTAAFPLPLFYLPQGGLWLSAIQLLIAAGLIGWAWRSDGAGGGPGFVDPALHREGFTLRRLLVLGGINILLAPLLAAAALVSGALLSLEKATAGYVRIRPSGLYITQSSFLKQAHTVALDGMIHVADSAFYDDLKWGVAGARTLVLLEGVTDQDKLLSAGLGMEKLAEFFGLKTQMETGQYSRTINQLMAKESAGDLAADGTITLDDSVDVRRADVDVNTFRPQTINYLKAAALLFQSTRSGRMEDFLKIMEDKKDVLQNEQIAKDAMQDILVNRNTHLIGQIEQGLSTHERIVIPWGAMHLAGIEEYLRSKGYAEIGRVEKPAVLFWKK